MTGIIEIRSERKSSIVSWHNVLRHNVIPSIVVGLLKVMRLRTHAEREAFRSRKRSGGREGTRKHEKRREEKRAVIRLAKSVCYLRPKINERRAEFGRLSERIGGAIRLVWKTGRASHRRLQHEKQPRPVGLGRSGSRPPPPPVALAAMKILPEGP